MGSSPYRDEVVGVFCVFVAPLPRTSMVTTTLDDASEKYRQRGALP
jgi:hypothetical protein